LRRVGGRIGDSSISQRCIGNARGVRLGLRTADVHRAIPRIGGIHIGIRRAGIVARRDLQRVPAAPQEASEDNRGETGQQFDSATPPAVHAQ
jgi:hypothetical protein